MSYLEHYASPYYDPVKAHEYYERTKKLKGRVRSNLQSSTEKIEDTKDRLSEQKSTNKQSIQTSTQKKIQRRDSSYKKQIESHKAIMKSNIERLRAVIDKMPPEEREAKKDAINGMIKQLKDRNARMKESALRMNATNRKLIRNAQNESNHKEDKKFEQRLKQAKK